MTTANFPLPVPNLDNQEFWDQCRQHRLVLRRCLDCRSSYHPPRPNCPECASSNLEWVESPGKGKVYTYVITRQPVNPAFRERLPWGVVEVELEEGVPDRGRYGLKSGCDIAWEGAPPSGILVVRPPDAGDPRCAFPANAIRCKKRLNRIYLTSPSHN